MLKRSFRLAFTSALTLAAACSSARPVSGDARDATRAAAPTVAKPFEYAPSTGQYRFTSTTKTSQDVMGQKNESQTTTNRLLTIAVARTAPDTVSLAVVIDSFTMVNSMGITPPGLDKLVGAKFSAKLSPAGSLYSADGPKEGDVPNAVQLTNEFSRTLPRINSILSLGAAWTDTLTDKLLQNGIELNRRMISRFSVAGDTTVGGEKVWKILRETSTTVAGSGSPSGQPITLESAGTGTGTIFLSQKGVLMGGDSEEQSTGKVLFAANGMEVGITSTSTTKVLKVK